MTPVPPATNTRMTVAFLSPRFDSQPGDETAPVICDTGGDNGWEKIVDGLAAGRLALTRLAPRISRSRSVVRPADWSSVGPAILTPARRRVDPYSRRARTLVRCGPLRPGVLVLNFV